MNEIDEIEKTDGIKDLYTGIDLHSNNHVRLQARKQIDSNCSVRFQLFCTIAR